MENKNIIELFKEMDELKATQKTIIRAKHLDVATLNKINKRLYEIRQILIKNHIKENQQNETEFI